MFDTRFDQPVIWTTKYDYGRVSVDPMEHDAAAMTSPWSAVTLARGTEWAASGELTNAIPPQLK